jgi:hypothetical protein
MPVSAWIMLVFGSLLLYGGLAYCLFIAAGSRTYTDEDFEDTEPDDAAG